MAGKDDRAGGHPDPTEMTPLIEDRQALEHPFSTTCEELRRLAYSVRRGDPSAT